ncbi:tRNA 2-methylthio-N6-isopentenyl adenosine(37) hydroxylase MiaE [Phaeocystidibacter marisrubri]|nr:tRNA 2-methylthio-N6-isopentenyl adenosine(37) hydroxylase MiaE [Phaeocystidibacter marisrubri]
MSMLGLKLPTDPRWVNIAEKNIEEILTDHAYCEQKAASTAISLIIGYHDYPELVEAMAALAREEMSHFEMVHQQIVKRGMKLGRERRDEYVHSIMDFFPKSGDRVMRLVHRLLIAGLIEARSCERFKVLSENIQDAELAEFYRRLMVSEANHYTMFLKFAREIGGREKVDPLWNDLLEYEATVMAQLGVKEHIHG